MSRVYFYKRPLCHMSLSLIFSQNALPNSRNAHVPCRLCFSKPCRKIVCTLTDGAINNELKKTLLYKRQSLP